MRKMHFPIYFPKTLFFLVVLDSFKISDSTPFCRQPNFQRSPIRANPQVTKWKDLSFYQKSSFSWTKPVLKVGYSRQLEANDLGCVIEPEDASILCSSFQQRIHSEIAPHQEFTVEQLAKVLFLENKKFIVVNGLMRLLNTVTQLLPSLLITTILKTLETTASTSDSTSTITDEQLHIRALSYSVGLSLVLTLKACVEAGYFYRGFLTGLRVKMTLSSAIFEKALVKSNFNQTLGEVVNLVQLDTEKVGEFVGYMHTLWDGLLQIVCYCVLLYQLLGSSAFVGVFLLTLLLPLNSFTFTALAAFKKRTSVLTDQRIKLISEVFQGIRLIKMQALESHFLRRLMSFRLSELIIAKSSSNTKALLHLLLSIAPTILFGVTIFTYALRGNSLTPSKVFGSLALFNQLRFPLLMYPIVLGQLADAKVSLGRISRFVSEPQLKKSCTSSHDLLNCQSSERRKSCVSLKHGTVVLNPGVYSWQHPMRMKQIVNNSKFEDEENNEKNRNAALLVAERVKIDAGELVMVVGKMGEGKSAVLLSLLNELHFEAVSRDSTMPHCENNLKSEVKEREMVMEQCHSNHNGSCTSSRVGLRVNDRVSGGGCVSGSVGYSSQSVWLPTTTLKRAIQFGRELDDGWYDKVIESCQLSQDIDSFPDAHDTFVGERGVALSGGQRQRISIARVCYAKPQVVLLDDSLSALDPTVARKLFHAVLDRKSGILANSTVVFATNQLKWLKYADRVIVVGKTQEKEEEVILEKVNKRTELSSCGDQISETNKTMKTSNPTISRIIGFGTVSELQKKGISFSKLKKTIDQSTSTSESILESDKFKNSSLLETPSNQNYHLKAIHMENDVNNQMKPENKQELSQSLTISDENSATKNMRNDPPIKAPVPSKRRSSVSDYKSVGAVSWKVYVAFLSSVRSWRVLVMFLASAFLGQSMSVSQQIFLSRWSGDVGNVKYSLNGYIVRLACLTLLATVAQACKAFAGIEIQLRSGTEIHRQLSNTLLRAPLSFFDNVPAGLLLQRFSKDMEVIDNSLSNNLGLVTNAILSIFGSFYTLVYASPMFMVTIWPLAFLYFNFLSFYRPGARELKRLESSLRSPVVDHFGETLSGTITLRAFGDFQLQRYKSRAIELIHNSTRASMIQKGVDRWLAIRLEVLGNSVVFLATLLAMKQAYGRCLPKTVLKVWTSTALFLMLRFHDFQVFQKLNDVFSEHKILKLLQNSILSTSSVLVRLFRVLSRQDSRGETAQEKWAMSGRTGLAIVNAMSVTGMLNWAVRTYTMLENDMISMERIRNVMQNCPLERDVIEDHDEIKNKITNNLNLELNASQRHHKLANWPVNGRVEFRNVMSQYHSDPPNVLHNVSFIAESQQRIGFIGRSGSGKSSLLATLLRLVDISSGGVYIDGINVKEVPLHVLRTRIGILAQEPTLFAGTVRSNLDPTAEHTDEELWQILAKCQMASLVQSLGKKNTESFVSQSSQMKQTVISSGLDAKISEFGQNLSAGQGQLLCLARTMLRKPKILLLDEATAAVDYSTDKLIQKTLQTEFVGVTTFVVAHRLSNVLNCDQVIVMDQGSIIEKGNPNDLRKNNNSVFARMLSQETTNYSESP